MVADARANPSPAPIPRRVGAARRAGGNRPSRRRGSRIAPFVPATWHAATVRRPVIPMSTIPLRPWFLALAVVACLPAGLPAQCAPQWQPGDPLPHVRGIVGATTSWDPDGAGPLPVRLVVGGTFQVGSTMATEVATFDGSEWVPLGDPPGQSVTALTVWNGQLIAAGSGNGTFLVSWNGSSWQPVGPFGQAGGWVRSLAVYNGELIAAGFFSHVDGVLCNSVARWNGTTWAAFGTGVTGSVYALAVWNGSLHVGGSMTAAGGVPISNYAVWNGSAWVADAAFNDTVTTLATRIGQTYPASYLFAGGLFTSFTIGGAFTTAAQHVARFSGSTNTWGAMGAGLGGTRCQKLLVVGTGINTFELTAATDDATNKVMRWTGSAWTNLGFVTDAWSPVTVWTLAYYAGKYVLALAQGDTAVKTYDAVNGWIPVRGRGIDDTVYAHCAVGNDVVIGGRFAKISGVGMNGIARGSANSWQPLGSGVSGGLGVFALATMANGDIVAGGDFTTAGGVQVGNIARWNGSAWSSLGLGTNGSVNALRVLPNGDLVAAGAFTTAGGITANRIARWNGTAWAPLGTGMTAQVNALALAGNGDLLAGGNFTTADGLTCNRVARWNGSAWSALGSGVDGAVFGVVVTPNGNVIVGGHFTVAGGVSAPYIARWDGSAWSPVGAQFGYRPTSDVLALAVLPDGDLVAGGAQWTFSLPFPVSTYISSNLGRLSSDANYQGTWSSLDVQGLVLYACTPLPNGDLLVGGEFVTAGGLSVGNLARLAPPCPALATTFAPGCASSGGSNTLSATALPWADGTFRAVATGLPPVTYAVAVWGLSPVLPPFPLDSFFAAALPGCNLHVTPDGTETLFTATGTVQSQIFVPNTPPIVGVSFYHQMVVIVADAQLNLLEVTSTNALQLTVGIF